MCKNKCQMHEFEKGFYFEKGLINLIVMCQKTYIMYSLLNDTLKERPHQPSKTSPEQLAAIGPAAKLSHSVHRLVTNCNHNHFF